jgi:hypothetical protein
MTDGHVLSSSLVETVAGFTAGVISTLAVHPLDIIKTRLQGMLHIHFRSIFLEPLRAPVAANDKPFPYTLSRPSALVSNWQLSPRRPQHRPE